MPKERRVPVAPVRVACAYVPFPRSTWIHPQVPADDFDRVCQNIWRRTKQVEVELGGALFASRRQQQNNTECASQHRRPYYK